MPITFIGGVHPKEAKLTSGSPIEVLPPPKTVYIPLSQHTGKPARLLVSKGDEVKLGQKIGEAQGFISANIHATVSGKVKSIGRFPHPVLGDGIAVEIENDGEDTWAFEITEHDYEKLTPQEIIDLVKEAGIVGLGGAAFPSHVKLSPPKEKPIEILILNGCECEPYLTCDHRVMLEFPEEVVKGGEIIARVVGAKRRIIAIEDNKPDAIALLKKKAADFEVIPVKTKYPEGAEKQLIYALTRREVPSGGLPMDVGCLVHNVGTAKAIYQAVRYRKPLIERVITVTGENIKEPKNLLVRIGTPAIEAINHCGGYIKPPEKLIFGGPMMGIAQYTDQVPVIKGTSGILVPAEGEIPEPGPCIRCGRCVDVCPMGLHPCIIVDYVENLKFDDAKRLGILDCIECGCCGYVCPVRRQLVHNLKFGKAEVWRKKD
ncbi:electron transport complex subunit RsxC [candidate division WOR-3 bacterium]|uniref:Ion-translocating oxidoreductase complex subunit C n=1 Tax=candidate division WOR-3 bacterium TaxID=2052148 RepID=A0A660SIQ0_UNCW3|nr:MAG: electron transport complex subunit RsxC [candidate division WOR-3 bacterium]